MPQKGFCLYCIALTHVTRAFYLTKNDSNRPFELKVFSKELKVTVVSAVCFNYFRLKRDKTVSSINEATFRRHSIFEGSRLATYTTFRAALRDGTFFGRVSRVLFDPSEARKREKGDKIEKREEL